MPSPATAPASLAEPAEAPETKQQRRLLQVFLGLVTQMFGGFPHLFRAVTDPRQAGSITYTLPHLLATGVLLFVMRLGARRQIRFWLRDQEPSATKFAALFDQAACPHGDTLQVARNRFCPSI